MTIIPVTHGVGPTKIERFPNGNVLIRRLSMIIRSQKGQGLAEYALILALIAIAAVVALVFLSGTINSILSSVGGKL